MIENFFSSWDLFHNTYLAGWFIGLLLSLLGVLVVAKDQIFIGAAISQASTLGVAVSLWISTSFAGGAFLWINSEFFLAFMAVLFSIAAALVMARADRGGTQSHEAITGWIFLFCSSVSVLIVARSPHGLEQINRLISSTIIGATRTDVWVLAALTGATIVLLAACCRRILLLTIDPLMAAAVGIRVAIWSMALAAWLGLAIGLSIRASGMLYTFGYLVLPALVAKPFCREVRSMFFVAPLIALASGIAGFVLANHYDFPPGQMSVAILASLLLPAGLLRRK